MNNSTVTSAEDLQLSALLAAELDATEQNTNTTESNKRKAKATKVLLSELSTLLETVGSGKKSAPAKGLSSKALDLVALLKKDPKKVAELLETLAAKGGDTKQLSKVLQALSIGSGTNQISISDVSALINALQKGSDVEERFKSLMNDANKYMKMADQAMDAQGVSKQEAMDHPKVKAILGAILGNAPAADDENNVNSMRDVKMKFALDLSKLISSIFEGQNDQSNNMTEMAKVMELSSKTICNEQIKAQQDELAKEQAVNNKPWYEYVIGAAVMLAGAALTLLTAGTAAPVVAAVCVSVIVGITMMSPAGDAITQGLNTALGGSDPSIGAQIGTSCIIAAITTVLTLGAGGFTTAAEGAAEVGEEAGEAVASAAAKGAGKLMYSTEALTAGLGKRAVGTLLQNIIGSGILIQGIQGLMQLTPEGQAALQEDGVEIALALGGAFVSFAAGYGMGLVTESGTEERTAVLKENGLEDGGVKGSKTWRTIVTIAEGLATTAQGTISISKYFTNKDLASAQKLLGQITAQYSGVELSQNRVQAIQSDITSQGQAVSKELMDIQGAVLDSIGEENQNIISAIVG